MHVSCIEDTCVLFSGASSGIGEATAKLFARLGAQLSITGRNESKLNQVGDECRQFAGVKHKVSPFFDHSVISFIYKYG